MVFKSEFIYLIEILKNPTVKGIVADFNFSEVSLNVLINLTDRNIQSIPKGSNSQDSDTAKEFNTKESLEEIFIKVKKELGNPLSSEDILELQKKCTLLTPMEFKNILIEHTLFDEFIEEISRHKDKDLTKHINSIFNL